MTIFRLQLFCKLFSHIIYGNIKTRYNVFKKIEYDVFGAYDFMVRKPLKSYLIRLLGKSPRSEALSKRLMQRDDGLILPTSYASALRLMLGASHLVALYATLVEQIFLGSLASKLADSLCVDYLAQVTTRRLSMTVAVAVAIEEASK